MQFTTEAVPHSGGGGGCGGGSNNHDDNTDDDNTDSATLQIRRPNKRQLRVSYNRKYWHRKQTNTHPHTHPTHMRRETSGKRHIAGIDHWSQTHVFEYNSHC